MLLSSLEKLSEFGINYLPGEAVLFYGFAGVGKTRFSSYFPVIALYDHLKRSGALSDKSVFVIINTDYSFSLDDLAVLCRENNVDYGDLRRYLWVEFVKHQTDLLAVLRAVFKAIKEGKREVKLIAIDKINDPYYEDIISYDDQRTFLRYSKDLTGLMISMIKQLLSYAHSHGIVLSWSARRRKLSDGAVIKQWYQEIYCGHVLQYAPAIVVKLDKVTGKANTVMLKVMKNRHGEEGVEISVEFTASGFTI